MALLFIMTIIIIIVALIMQLLGRCVMSLSDTFGTILR